MLFIVFIYKYLILPKQFHLFYTCISIFISDQCGGHIHLSAGDSYQIESPNYPQGYSHSTECSWVLESPNNKLTLQFIDEFEIRCDWGTCVHWVEVNANKDNKVPGYRFCCSKRPEAIVTSQHGRLVIQFKSPHSTSYKYKGFRAVIKSGRYFEYMHDYFNMYV